MLWHFPSRVRLIFAIAATIASLSTHRYYSDPANHARAVDLVAQATKQPAARFTQWIFTKADYYRDPDGIPNLTALQANIETQHDLGYLENDIDVKKYADLALVTAAAKRIATKV